MSNINVTPEQVQTLGATCETQTQEIDTLIAAIQNQITSTQWESQAATRFKGDWETHRGNLVRLRDELHALGQAAKTMAENYSQADASYGRS